MVKVKKYEKTPEEKEKDYERARNWIRKNLDPTKYKTLDDFEGDVRGEINSEFLNAQKEWVKEHYWDVKREKYEEIKPEDYEVLDWYKDAIRRRVGEDFIEKYEEEIEERFREAMGVPEFLERVYWDESVQRWRDRDTGRFAKGL